ncbi:thioredoxin reductase [Streptomyces sp. V4I23]|uniref:NAD(P)/FAD-dependent oxidoreductase n=1 Tax=Streptomyces sp. V4I23 TaxID=3042282 RepID=UPI002789CDE0|nr:FAD-dependent oxidoreductase [Streptomyces sp. V4I23]MDQ1006930.1 thioredoxin reductase [Streptomyces sp. V4I23]
MSRRDLSGDAAGPQTRRERAVDVLVVGTGPAGLAAAARLAAHGAGRVEAVEREQEPGGSPRHSPHRGFGPRHRPLDGPSYARGLVDAATAAGAVLRTSATVTDWAGPLTVDLTTPAGLERVTARAVVLATGARERPRSARLVPGTRPDGVLTTGELLRSAHRFGRRAGGRAVVVGSEPVALTAVRTLRGTGTQVVALVTERAHGPLQSPRHRVPVLTGTTVAELTGRGRLTGVRLLGPDGALRLIACDTVVFTGDWIPDHELARHGGVPLDPVTRGPAVDTALRTARAGVFAAGSLLRGTEPAATAADEGRHAAAAVLRHLGGSPWPGEGLPVRCEPPLLRITPNVVTPAGPPPPRGRFLLRTAERLPHAVLVVEQDGRLLHRQPLPGTAVPDRAVHLWPGWLGGVDRDGGAVRISIMSDFRQPGTVEPPILAL